MQGSDTLTLMSKCIQAHGPAGVTFIIAVRAYITTCVLVPCRVSGRSMSCIGPEAVFTVAAWAYTTACVCGTWQGISISVLASPKGSCPGVCDVVCPQYFDTAVEARVSARITKSSALVFTLDWLVSFSLEEGSERL